MVLRDLKRLAKYEEEWSRLHPVDPLAKEKEAWAQRLRHRWPEFGGGSPSG